MAFDSFTQSQIENSLQVALKLGQLTGKGIRLKNQTSFANLFSDDLVTGQWSFQQFLQWYANTAFLGVLSHTNTANRTYTFKDASGTVAFISDITNLVPPGCIMLWPTLAPPSGWLQCDGTTYLNSAHTALAAVLGTTYGGDATHFSVPDLRGRTPFGYDSANVTGRLTSPLDASALGNTGGEQAHTLTSAEMPAHTHPGDSGNNFAMSGGGALDGDVLATTAQNRGLVAITGSTGGGGAHNNIPPGIILVYIIKT